MKNTTSPFIQQTAKDYDLSVEIVQRVYDKYGSTNSFYDELEQIIKQRASQN